jgi:RimJ/RimL family protein N-acetyltransferase
MGAQLPSFTTARLQLAPASPADVDVLWAIWRDPDVRRYLFDDEEVTRERASEALERCLAAAERGLGLWTIRERGAAPVIGCVGIVPALGADFDPENLRGAIEPLAALAPANWHRGYACEALAALIGYAFADLRLERLAGATDVPNDASHRMLLRLGFTVVGECEGPAYRMRTYRLDAATFRRRHA